MLDALRDIVARFLAGFRTPTRRQSAALCWRRGDAGAVEILLVTTRRTGRWTPPKGNPMKKRSPSEVAAREAWEEAGVEGTVDEAPLGEYRLLKNRDIGVWEPMTVEVFPLIVDATGDDYPEEGQRNRRWFSQDAAASVVRERDLARLIRDFSPPSSLS